MKKIKIKLIINMYSKRHLEPVRKLLILDDMMNQTFHLVYHPDKYMVHPVCSHYHLVLH